MPASSARADGLKRPPGELPVVGHLFAVARDILGALDRWAVEVGDVYRFDVPGRRILMINRPDEIERVLVHQEHFVRSIDSQLARDVVGYGLLTIDGEPWRRRRHMMQPAFQRQRIAGYGDRMVHLTESAMARWSPGEVRDMHKETMALTLKIATDTLFGDDEVPPEQVGAAMGGVIGRFDGVKSLLPTSAVRVLYPSFTRGIETLDKVVYALIARRRADSSERKDLLSILLGLADENGAPMTDRELRDEMVALLAASHETTANAVAWTWYLDQWKIDGCQVGAGMQVLLGTWVVHRDPRFYAEPLQFRPERWLDKSLDGNPTYAYFPFGGGQRLCIGRGFALLETILVLATVARRYRLRAISDDPIAPIPSFTLRPRGGVPLRVEAR